ncbi:uncharacterized protein LTR77_009202 [Saxophila tyrrhenica]|uniref:Major facilitator superfamily (MFS) profile domain-containing protein n=1 Tax=Saxophila tyrrhenica TaxID=1690608 RepID=A0AAV9P298_9PEZI|nr:hypothetical protein LTR77_009202 [Saxophila tyrrhenica]
MANSEPTTCQSITELTTTIATTSPPVAKHHRPQSVLEPIRDGEPLKTTPASKAIQRLSTMPRQLSLRTMTRPSDDELRPPMLPPALPTSRSAPHIRLERLRPVTHPSSSFDGQPAQPHINPRDLETLLDGYNEKQNQPSQPSSRPSTPVLSPKPRRSFVRLSSLDNLMTYREEMAEWRRLSRSSSLRRPGAPDPYSEDANGEHRKTFALLDDSATSSIQDENMRASTVAGSEDGNDDANRHQTTTPAIKRSKFRHRAAEIGFCFTIAMTQFLAEYLISGFAIELPRLVGGPGGSESMGIFWPASLLSLILSATLFLFARLSDMYSGYFIFMSGVAWLAIWTIIPGFCRDIIWLDVSRAMQGLAIAAFTPSTFSLVGGIYPEGPRRNFVMGLYSGCAPMGFFAGFLTAGALPVDKPQWFFFIAAILAATTFLTAFLSCPTDRVDRKKLGLKMDWIGAFLIMSGLILVSYALAVEPYANQHRQDRSSFAFPIVIGPFSSGMFCLAAAFWYEGWRATCPLLPFDFFKPKSVKPFALACLFFYASYGVWLYNSAQYLKSPTTAAGGIGRSGMTLALWYTPTAVGGIILCIIGGSLVHIVPIMVLLLLSAVAWVAAPLLLALAPLPLNYWSFVMPSMLCATVGIDLTFTVSIVFFSSVQPIRYQGLSGAVCSSLVNLAMSFALSISEIVMKQTSSTRTLPKDATNWGYKATFLYAAASAGVGLVLCVAFVKISRAVVQQQPLDEERQLGPTLSDSTLVEGDEERHGGHA